MTNWTAVWVLFAGGLSAGMQLTKVPPALPGLRDALGLTLVQSGFVQTMVYAIGAALAVFFGVVADRFGPRHAALAGLLSMGAGGVLGAASPGFAVLLASRFLEGLGFILYVVGAMPLLSMATAARDRPTAFSIWSAYMPGGGFLALLLAPPALAAFGWRALWVVVAAFALLSAIALLRCVPPAPPARQTRARHLLTDTLASPGVLALSLAFICYVGQWASVMTWLPTFAVDERGASEGTAALLTAAFVVMNIPGVQLGGMLLKRGHSRGKVLAGGAIAMAATSLVFLSAGAPDALRIACVLIFSLLGGVVPVAVFTGAAAHARTAEHIGTTNGLVMQASHLSQFVVPIFVAWMASRSGWSGSLAAMLSLAALGTLAAVAIARIERR